MKNLLLKAGFTILGASSVLTTSAVEPTKVTNETVVETYNYEQIHEINVTDVYKINGVVVSYEEWNAYKTALENGTVLQPDTSNYEIEENLHQENPTVEESENNPSNNQTTSVYLYGNMTNAQLLSEYQFTLDNNVYTLETELNKGDFFLVTDGSNYLGSDHLKEENTFVQADSYHRIVAQLDGTYQISFDGEYIDVSIKGAELLKDVVFADSEEFYHLITNEGTHFDYLAVYNRGETPSGSFENSVCGLYQTINYNNEILHYVNTSYTTIYDLSKGSVKYLNLSCFKQNDNELNYSQYLVNCFNLSSPGGFYDKTWNSVDSGIYILTDVLVKGYKRSPFTIGLIPIEQTVLTYNEAFTLEEFLNSAE